MTPVTSLVLRRMRAPLIALIVTYAIAILGLVLTPGMDEQGKIWHMGFFHGIYVASSTIVGIGSEAVILSDTQRAWVLLYVYPGVFAWMYTIGTMLAIVQDEGFKRVLAEGRFAKSVQRLREPFYIICGYGEIGRAMVTTLIVHNVRVVVMEENEERMDMIRVDNHRVQVPALCADVRDPQKLIEAGLRHSHCLGVIALTADEQTNLKIAIIVKSLHPEAKVICRCETEKVAANMLAFGTEHAIDPFHVFAERLSMALHAPGLYLLYDWLSGAQDADLTEPIYPPHGMWLLCGYGRFGKAIHQRLEKEDVSTIILEPEASLVEGLETGVVLGRGTDAPTLRQARIDLAAGVVAGTNTDENNLSIIMTARQLKPNLFIVARQNHQENRPLYEAVGADITMQTSDILARQIRVLLTAPLLITFFEYARKENNDWANITISRLAAVLQDSLPEVWSINLRCEDAYAVCFVISQGRRISISNLLQDPRARERQLSCVPLLMIRQGQVTLMPEDEDFLEIGDELLFCGDRGIALSMRSALTELHTLNYIMKVDEDPDGVVWSWFHRRFKKVERRSGARERVRV